jgi:hypothetical protein
MCAGLMYASLMHEKQGKHAKGAAVRSAAPFRFRVTQAE